jgi:hypothetical protein
LLFLPRFFVRAALEKMPSALAPPRLPEKLPVTLPPPSLAALKGRAMSGSVEEGKEVWRRGWLRGRLGLGPVVEEEREARFNGLGGACGGGEDIL